MIFLPPKLNKELKELGMKPLFRPRKGLTTLDLCDQDNAAKLWGEAEPIMTRVFYDQMTGKPINESVQTGIAGYPGPLRKYVLLSEMDKLNAIKLQVSKMKNG